MTLYLNGHTYKYELEHLIKMFFPMIKLGISYENTQDDPNAVVTTLTEETEEYRLMVTVRYKGETVNRMETVNRFRSDASAECERIFGVLIYELLESLTGISPKWGILTGIRPVKLVSSRLEDGETDKQIIDDLEENYKVKPQKTKLLLETAKVIFLPYLYDGKYLSIVSSSESFPSSTSCITATAVNCFVSEAILKHVSVEFFVCLSLSENPLVPIYSRAFPILT